MCCGGGRGRLGIFGFEVRLQMDKGSAVPRLHLEMACRFICGNLFQRQVYSLNSVMQLSKVCFTPTSLGERSGISVWENYWSEVDLTVESDPAFRDFTLGNLRRTNKGA